MKVLRVPAASNPGMVFFMPKGREKALVHFFTQVIANNPWEPSREGRPGDSPAGNDLLVTDGIL